MGAEPQTTADACARDSSALLVGEVTEACTGWLSSANVTTADDGETALALADANVDAILIPRHCADMPGEELVSKLRKRGIEAPAGVVLSADADIEVLELGFDECVRRPLTERKVRTILGRLVRRQTYNRLLRRYYRLVTCRNDPTIRGGEKAQVGTRARIEAELRDVRNQLAEIEDELTPGEYEALFRDLRQALDEAGGN
ncbi:response regulator transcription factor [Halorussus salinus]|uniref:response regulator transcription factor n=1 Tax=Halorussus salinus TaxID=1364935 RepID=UPI0010918EA9|nr:response regulator transcription factor [Halorussus salinus]